MVNKTNEIVSNLKGKIDAIEKKAQAINTKEANEIKERAVDILNRVTNKFIEASRNVLTSQEYEQGFEFVCKKSDELFNSAMNKLEQMTPKKEEIKIDSIKDQAINEMDAFIEDAIKKEIKTDLIDENRIEENVDIKGEMSQIEEKAIVSLKEWFSLGKDA